mgnify:CR=1 FL=1
MRENIFKYSIIAVSVFMALFSVAILHCSIRLVENSSIPERSPKEMKVIIEKVIERIQDGEIPDKDIEAILLSNNESYAGNFSIVEGLIGIQKGLVSIMEAILFLYIVILVVYFFRKRT